MTEFIGFSTDDFPFDRMVAGALGVENLSQLHGCDNELLRKGTDQSTIWHRRFYDAIDKTEFGVEFYALYKKFIRELALPQLEKEEFVVYQTLPTFRVHLPNNVAVFAYHRDREYNHPRTETNVFMPLTAAFESNTIWIESEEGKEDFSPIEADFGTIAVFKGCDLLHGNKVNVTDVARVSFDFRFIPWSQYTKSEGCSLTKGHRFAIGDYYEMLEL
jgi:hypothetical protein